MSHLPARCNALNRWLAVIATVSGLGLSTISHAQDAQRLELPNLIGIGIGLTPDYAGADSRSLAAGPFLHYRFPDSQRSIAMLGPLLTFNVVDNSAWHAGPVLRYRQGREDADNPVVHQLHKIDSTAEAGAFVSYVFSGKGSVPWLAQISTGALSGFSSADGTRAWIDAQLLMPLSHRLILGLGGSFNVVDGKTMNSYFGVTPADSVASGLPVFQPGGGNSSNELWLAAAFLVNSKWVIGVGGYWQHLRGNAAASPWVSEQGDANQVTVGAGIAYIWK